VIFLVSRMSKSKGFGMSFSLGGKSNLKKSTAKVAKTAPASTGFQFEEEAPEHIPKGAKLSRNMGWQTETSSGPNSFGKSKTGFHAPNVPPEFRIGLLQGAKPDSDGQGPSFEERQRAAAPKVDPKSGPLDFAAIERERAAREERERELEALERGKEGYRSASPSPEPERRRGFTDEAPTRRGFTEEAPARRGFTEEAPARRGFTEEAPTKRGFTEQATESRERSPPRSPERKRQRGPGCGLSSWLPQDELQQFTNPGAAPPPVKGTFSDSKLGGDNIGFQMLQKSGWKEGEGLGSSKTGTQDPLAINIRDGKVGIGANTKAPQEGDSEFDLYKKRMSKAYTFRPTGTDWRGS